MIRIDSKKLKENTKKLKGLHAGISAGPDVVVANSGTFFRKMQKKFAFAYRDTKDYIQNQAKTRTGIERRAAGLGFAGRFETGEMYRAFIMSPGGGNTSYRGKKVRFNAEMGWLREMPEYTLFQEYGTRRGIVAMNALGEGAQFLKDYIYDDLAKDEKEFARQVAEGWALAMRKGVRIRTKTPTDNWWAKSAADDGEE